MDIKVPKTGRGRRELKNRAPKLVETGKKALLLHGTKTSSVVNSLLGEIFWLKNREAVKFSRKNDNIRPFEAGGETSLEFFSQKTDCGLFVFGSHSKKRPNNLVIGRMFDHHVYDLVEVGVESFRSMQSYNYDKKYAPQQGSKPFFAFIGDFEASEELKQLKEVLLDLFRGEVIDNLNLTGVDRVYVCTAVSPKSVFLMHCAILLKKSGTPIPRIELVETGPSMDLVIRRHRLPHATLRKEAFKTGEHAKKAKNVTNKLEGKVGRIYIPDQQVGDMPLSNDIKGLKRERRDAKRPKSSGKDSAKKRKTATE